MKTYATKKWLNSEKDPSTGAICCYAGPAPWQPKRKTLYLEVSDCHNSVRLHKNEIQTKKDFINKLVSLKEEIDNFINFLKE